MKHVRPHSHLRIGWMACTCKNRSGVRVLVIILKSNERVPALIANCGCAPVIAMQMQTVLAGFLHVHTVTQFTGCECRLESCSILSVSVPDMLGWAEIAYSTTPVIQHGPAVIHWKATTREVLHHHLPCGIIRTLASWGRYIAHVQWVLRIPEAGLPTSCGFFLFFTGKTWKMYWRLIFLLTSWKMTDRLLEMKTIYIETV